MEQRRKVGRYGLPLAKPVKQGPEVNPWFWHPDRKQGGPVAPLSFVEELEKVDEGLAVAWNPVRENWAVWQRAPKYPSGWRLLFIHHDGQGGYLPLDNRLFARLYAADMRNWGSARKYFDQVQAQVERDREAEEKRYQDELMAEAVPHFDYSQIKNIGHGSKFSTYHA